MVTDQLAPKTTGKAARTVERRDNITRKEFIKEYVEPSIPVILTHAADNWKAMGKVTPQYIKATYGHLSKKVKGVEYTFSDFIDRMLTSTPENPAPYPFNINVEKDLPDLRNDIKPELVYGKIDRVNHPLLPRFMMHGTEVYELFMGGNGASFPFLHIDELYLHNQMTQLYGSKEFILFSPDQTKYLYPGKDNPKVSPIDVFNPDYEKYPLFREAQPLRVTVQQGETLFFPTGWWHSTQIHEPCISLGRVHLNRANWNDFVNDEYRLWKSRGTKLALPIYLYGKALGQLMNFQEMFR